MNFLGVPLVPYQSSGELIEDIVNQAKNTEKGIICYLNADTYNRTQKDPSFLALMKKAMIVYADGISISWTARFLLKTSFPRLTAADYFGEFLAEAEKGQLQIFFLGSKTEVLEKLCNRLKTNYPSLKAAFHHGYFSEQEEREVINTIKSFGPHLVIAAMGSPRQEQWSQRAADILQCPIWNVGALLDFYTGEIPRAPRFMQKAGLEWLYRLFCEPRRLWKRYCQGNVLFFFHIIKAYRKKKLGNE